MEKETLPELIESTAGQVAAELPQRDRIIKEERKAV